MPIPVLDKDGRIALVCAGRPNDSSYDESARKACEALLREASATTFRREEINHKRGVYPVVNAGITYGNGPIEPIRLNNGKHADVVERLLENPDVKRLAHFQSAAYALWNPNVYQYTKIHMDEIYEKMPHLPRNFPKSVYSNIAFNMGPQVVTAKHKDGLNLPFGWCAIHALGNFNPKVGGHLVLWELKLVIEFPPGSLILLPSATITHSNTEVSGGEVRLSMTQYSTGALFRYAHNNFMTEDVLAVKDPERHQEICELKSLRWKAGLSLYSTMADILDSA
ncbi:hypothetical protein CPC08DRAFT_648268 [Agrocybe pediades]|nr:hypothetical protein CPC08DRAFT_648268 [Agrocybe pediades]